MGKNLSFQDVLEHRRDLLHRRAIWKEMVDHLNRFVDTDAAKTKHGIRCDTEEMVVPQIKILEVVGEIENGYLAEIAEELNKIDKSEVAEHVEQKDVVVKKASGKGKVGKAPRAKRKPTSVG